MIDKDIHTWEEDGGAVPVDKEDKYSKMSYEEYKPLMDERIKIFGPSLDSEPCQYKCLSCKAGLSCSECLWCCTHWLNKRDEVKLKFEQLRDEYVESAHVREDLELAFQPTKDKFLFSLREANGHFDKTHAETITNIAQAGTLEKEKELALRKQMLEYGKLSGLKTLSPGAIVTASTKTIITDGKAAHAFCKEKGGICMVVDVAKLIATIEAGTYEDEEETLSEFYKTETTNNTKLEKKLTERKGDK